MGIEILILALAILMIAWALERILLRLMTIERHVIGMRKRLNDVEFRIVSKTKYGKSRTITEQKREPVAPQKVQSISSVTDEFKPGPLPEIEEISGDTYICAFCGTEYDVNFDKCPKCNHINIEKYRVHRKDDITNEDFDI